MLNTADTSYNSGKQHKQTGTAIIKLTTRFRKRNFVLKQDLADFNVDSAFDQSKSTCILKHVSGISEYLTYHYAQAIPHSS